MWNYEPYFPTGSPPHSPRSSSSNRRSGRNRSYYEEVGASYQRTTRGFQADSRQYFGRPILGYSEKISPAQVNRARNPNVQDTRCPSTRHLRTYDLAFKKQDDQTPTHVGVIHTEDEGGSKKASVFESVPKIGNSGGSVQETAWERQRQRRDGTIRTTTYADGGNVWIARPSEEVQDALEEKKGQARENFETNFKGAPYNDALVRPCNEAQTSENKGKKPVHCGELTTDYLNSQLSDKARNAGANIAADRRLTFDEKWQRTYYKSRTGQEPPVKEGETDLSKMPLGLAPSDAIARGHYDYAFKVDPNKPRCDADPSAPSCSPTPSPQSSPPYSPLTSPSSTPPSSPPSSFDYVRFYCDHAK